MFLLSEHITMKEATRSNTAVRFNIENFPSNETIISMQAVAENIFEPLRKYINEPIYISSFYRSPELNKTIGGSTRSQHCKGEAIDIDDVYSKKFTNADYFNFIKDNLTFDQLIWEFGDHKSPDWVHVSYALNNRNRILKAYKENGKTTYVQLS
jgi:zinc D-Ala-D-Ala carboxypeptidase